MGSASLPSWERASDALFIEEMISSAFHDFAPYAGAEQQQLRLVRQQSDGTATTVVLEENGNWSVDLTNPCVGNVGFATTRNVALDLRAFLPLSALGKWFPISPESPASVPRAGADANAAPVRRFAPGAPARAPAPVPPPAALELLCSPWRDRHGIGLRTGPFAVRATARSMTRSVADSTMSSGDATHLSALRRVPVVLDGTARIPLGGTGWHMSAALQCPIGAADGDTLGALCLDARRQREKVRVVAVQTLSTSGGLSDTQESWSERGTLIGVNVSLYDELLRLSASTIIQDGSVDFETAVVADATPFLTKPTLVKVGVNKIGRIGIGVATKVFDALTVILGVHRARGGDTRFGLEIAF